MENYRNINGNSNIENYELGEDYIIIEFKQNKFPSCCFYKYTYSSTGLVNIEHMKKLAVEGGDLSAFTKTKEIKTSYESKW